MYIRISVRYPCHISTVPYDYVCKLWRFSNLVSLYQLFSGDSLYAMQEDRIISSSSYYYMHGYLLITIRESQLNVISFYVPQNHDLVRKKNAFIPCLIFILIRYSLRTKIFAIDFFYNFDSASYSKNHVIIIYSVCLCFTTIVILSIA